MANTTVEISELAHEFAEQKAKEKGLGSAGAYLERLVKQAKRRDKIRARVERLLIEGLESGPAEPFTSEDLEAMRQRLRDRLAARQRA
jgi:hypothetical protein